jgi:hypothetical protein
MPSVGLEKMELSGLTCLMGAGNLIAIGEDQRRTTYPRVLDESAASPIQEGLANMLK